MTEPAFDPEPQRQPDLLLDTAPASAGVRAFTETPYDPDRPPPVRTLHRYAGARAGFNAHTSCGLNVGRARTTQRWADVTCANCQRSAPEGSA